MVATKDDVVRTMRESQREIEKAVDGAIKSGKLKGTEKLKARAVLALEGLAGEIRVEGEIALA